MLLISSDLNVCTNRVFEDRIFVDNKFSQIGTFARFEDESGQIKEKCGLPKYLRRFKSTV
jgi:hypothetical protein